MLNLSLLSSSLLAATASLPPAYYLAPLGAVLALVFAVVFYKGFMAESEGDAEMVRIAQAVREGAYAYLGKQRNVVAVVFVLLLVLLCIMAFALGLQEQLTPLGVAIAGIFSGACGYLGMKTATNASARTTHAAKTSLNDGLKVAFRAGAVMGLCVTGFALLDVSVWFFVLTQFFGDTFSLVDITTITLSFAMGASLQALFARVGGGIYTKAADVGADLVGKVEAGIPEDDARNPATIADNVGDNVGDVAGMGADLYESYYGSILAAMALAAAAALRLGLDGAESIALVCTPPALAGLGILCSILSIYLGQGEGRGQFRPAAQVAAHGRLAQLGAHRCRLGGAAVLAAGRCRSRSPGWDCGGRSSRACSRDSSSPSAPSITPPMSTNPPSVSPGSPKPGPPPSSSRASPRA